MWKRLSHYAACMVMWNGYAGYVPGTVKDRSLWATRLQRLLSNVTAAKHTGPAATSATVCHRNHKGVPCPCLSPGEQLHRRTESHTRLGRVQTELRHQRGSMPWSTGCPGLQKHHLTSKAPYDFVFQQHVRAGNRLQMVIQLRPSHTLAVSRVL